LTPASNKKSFIHGALTKKAVKNKPEKTLQQLQNVHPQNMKVNKKPAYVTENKQQSANNLFLAKVFRVKVEILAE